MKNLIVLILLVSLISCKEESGRPIIGPYIYQIYDEDGELFVPNNAGYCYSKIIFETKWLAKVDTWNNDSLIVIQQGLPQVILNYSNGDKDTLDVRPIPKTDEYGKWPEYPDKIVYYFNGVLQDTIDFHKPLYSELNHTNVAIFNRYQEDQSQHKLIVFPLIKTK